MRRFPLALLVALCLLSPLARAKTIQTVGFPPGSREPSVLNAGLPDDLYGYHPDDDSSWGESWSIQAINDAGDFVYVLMSVSNYNPFHKFGGTVDLFYYPNGGERNKAHAEFQRDAIRADRKRVSIDIDGNVFSGAYPTYRVKAAVGDVAMDLTFTVQTPDLLLGQGPIRFGADRSWRLTVLAPRAAVTGTITAGGKTVEYTGRAYIDHGWSTYRIYQFSKRWYVLRVLDDDLSLNAIRMEFKDDFEPNVTQAVYVTLGDRVIANSGALELTPIGAAVEPRSGEPLPESYAVRYEQGGTKLTGTVRMVRVGEALSVLDQLTPFLRKIVRALVTDPWQFRFQGEADLTLVHDGRTRKITGPVVGEVHSYR